MRDFSPSALAIPSSGVREIMNLALGLKDVIRLEIGEPDFQTPEHIVRGAMQGIEDGFTRYTQSAGLLSLRTLLAEKIERRTGVAIDPDGVIVGAGGIQALYAALLALVDRSRGDEVLIPDPGFANCEMAILAVGGRPVHYPLRIGVGFVPDVADLKRLVTPHTRVLMVNSPGNPTGAVFPRTAIEHLVEFACRHDLWIISDEVYEELVFDGEHVSPFPMDPERTLLANSFSKTYAMTGWRVGYLATTDPDLARLLWRVQESQIACVPGPVQKAAEAALTGPQDCVAEMRASYRERRDAVVELLQEHGRLSYRPSGAFYVMLDIETSGLSSMEFAKRLLLEEHVAVAPGSAFGDESRQQVRISLATDRVLLLEGVDRACRFLRRVSAGAPSAAVG
jgi:aspartate/methionine/tyrosine aminotransferase